MAEHIHEVGDGRGLRHVYVNGKRVYCAVYADTKKGIVDYYPTPSKIHRREKRIISRRLRGDGRVEFING